MEKSNPKALEVSEGAKRLAESEWRQAGKMAAGPASHPSSRQPAPRGDEAGLRAMEWARARPSDHEIRKAMVGCRQAIPG